jgi:MFS family permease
MTFRMVCTQHLPTLALVALGASELVVGVQNALVFACIALQLPTLRLVARIPKRTILVWSHFFSVLWATPLIFFAALADSPHAIALAMLCFAMVAAGNGVGDGVWFPLLRGFMEPNSVGRFFGILRSGWHCALILYFVGSNLWLGSNPGSFGPLFAVAWALGLIRVPFIVRLPERSERSEEGIRVREAVALLRESRLRRYLVASAGTHAVRAATAPFVLVMLRRSMGWSEADALWTSVAIFSGGLASLYLWGIVADRVGAIPVFAGTILAHSLLILGLALWVEPGLPVWSMVLWFLTHSILISGFGVADTQIVFHLAPEHAPARTIVVAATMSGLLAGLMPVLAGAGLDTALPADPSLGLPVYRNFLFGMALLQAAVCIPVLGRGRLEER